MTGTHRFIVDSVEELERAASSAMPPPDVGERALVNFRGRQVELEVVERGSTQCVWQQARSSE